MRTKQSKRNRKTKARATARALFYFTVFNLKIKIAVVVYAVLKISLVERNLISARTIIFGNVRNEYVAPPEGDIPARADGNAGAAAVG